MIYIPQVSWLTAQRDHDGYLWMSELVEQSLSVYVLSQVVRNYGYFISKSGSSHTSETHASCTQTTFDQPLVWNLRHINKHLAHAVQLSLLKVNNENTMLHDIVLTGSHHLKPHTKFNLGHLKPVKGFTVMLSYQLRWRWILWQPYLCVVQIDWGTTAIYISLC